MMKRRKTTISLTSLTSSSSLLPHYRQRYELMTSFKLIRKFLIRPPFRSPHFAQCAFVQVHERHHHRRHFTISQIYRRGNVLAKYARPTFPPLTSSPSLSTDDVFTTAATEVAGTSFQSVPPPDSDSIGKDGAHQEKALPAMVPIAPSGSHVISAKECGEPNSTQKGEGGVRKKEMVVQGVPIPPKPIPPGEEGKSTSANRQSQTDSTSALYSHREDYT